MGAASNPMVEKTVCRSAGDPHTEPAYRHPANHLDMVGQRPSTVCRLTNKVSAPLAGDRGSSSAADIADHQGVPGQHEPGLISHEYGR